MLRSDISKQLKDEIIKEHKDGSTIGISRVRGKMEVYFAYQAITVHEFNELLDIAVKATGDLIDKGARPYVFSWWAYHRERKSFPLICATKKIKKKRPSA